MEVKDGREVSVIVSLYFLVVEPFNYIAIEGGGGGGGRRGGLE